MEFIDSHCHLPPLSNKPLLDKVLQEALSEEVVRFVNIGTSVKNNELALDVARKYDHVFSTAAIYPHEDLGESLPDLRVCLENFVVSNRLFVVAVGECGIDISDWEGGRSLEDQIPLFEMQAELAKKLDLPLIVHNRNGEAQVLDVLRGVGSNKGVIHCFSSSWEFAKSVLDLGFYISFSGFITYENRNSLLETVRKVPVDRILIETDSPYIPPAGHRGEKNMPKYVKLVAQKVSDIKGITLGEVADFSTNNARRLFNI